MIPNYKDDDGNVLFLILVALLLFGALSFVITSNSRTSDHTGNKEQALIASSEIIQFSTALANAVTFLRVSHRCGINQISFERAPFDGSDADYVNLNAPSNFNCHIFHKEGARVSYVAPPDRANDSSDWAFIQAQVIGMGADQTACGADCSDILLLLENMNESTCEILNLRMTGDKASAIQGDGANYETHHYDGQFTNTPDIDGIATGQVSMCIEDANGKRYFYSVLQPR